jgi:hypothetical protein
VVATAAEKRLSVGAIRHQRARAAPSNRGTLCLGLDRLEPSLMLRTCSRVIAFVVMVACVLVTAQAADTVLTLPCKGTTTETSKENAKPEPHSQGIIVNFTARTVTGFAYPGADIRVTVSAWDDLHIMFAGSNKDSSWTIDGSIDRVTGDTAVTSMWFNLKTGEVSSSTDYTLKCRPAQRMF